MSLNLPLSSRSTASSSPILFLWWRFHLSPSTSSMVDTVWCRVHDMCHSSVSPNPRQPCIVHKICRDRIRTLPGYPTDISLANELSLYTCLYVDDRRSKERTSRVVRYQVLGEAEVCLSIRIQANRAKQKDSHRPDILSGRRLDSPATNWVNPRSHWNGRRRETSRPRNSSAGNWVRFQLC